LSRAAPRRRRARRPDQRLPGRGRGQGRVGTRRGGAASRMSFLFFDIETRVDKSLLRATLLRDQAVSDEEAYEILRGQLLRDTGSDFVPLSLHVPVSIAIAAAADDLLLSELEVLRADRIGEAGLVRAFWERLEAFPGTLVSFNGRGFDLPVLELQALRH